MITVIEMQNGAIGDNKWVYANENEAKSKFYAQASIAAVSQVAVHTVIIITDEGFMLEPPVCFKHPLTLA